MTTLLHQHKMLMCILYTQAEVRNFTKNCIIWIWLSNQWKLNIWNIWYAFISHVHCIFRFIKKKNFTLLLRCHVYFEWNALYFQFNPSSCVRYSVSMYHVYIERTSFSFSRRRQHATAHPVPGWVKHSLLSWCLPIAGNIPTGQLPQASHNHPPRSTGLWFYYPSH